MNGQESWNILATVGIVGVPSVYQITHASQFVQKLLIQTTCLYMLFLLYLLMIGSLGQNMSVSKIVGIF